MNKLDVVCIGAANVDTIARVGRFPSADEQVAVTSLTEGFGGSAANTAVALAKLGMRVGFIGKVGSDACGKQLLGNLEASGIDTSRAIADPGVPSGRVFIAVSPTGERIMFQFPGAPQALTGNEINGMQDYFQAASIVHLASLKITGPFEVAASICGDRNVIASFNPGTMLAAAGYDRVRYIIDHVDILACSRSELGKLFGKTTIEENVASCFSRTSVRLIALTLSAEGSRAFTRHHATPIVPPYKVPVVDTTGAGDAFCAGVLHRACKELQATRPAGGSRVTKDDLDRLLGKEKGVAGFLLDCLKHGNAVAAFKIRAEGAQGNLPHASQVGELIRNGMP